MKKVVQFQKSISLVALRLFNKSLIPTDLSVHPPGDFISDWIIAHNRYYEFDMLAHIARNFDYSRFVDIGANIGNHSHYFKKLGATGWAFEPSQRNFFLLTQNLDGGAFACYNTALSNMEGVEDLVTFENSNGNSYVLSAFEGRVNNWGGGIGIEAIETQTLDSFGIENPTFIKIDVEGSELRVLQGAKHTLTRFSPTIAIEIHEDSVLKDANFPYSKTEIFTFLFNFGYKHLYSYNLTNHFFAKSR